MKISKPLNQNEKKKRKIFRINNYLSLNLNNYVFVSLRWCLSLYNRKKNRNFIENHSFSKKKYLNLKKEIYFRKKTNFFYEEKTLEYK